MGLSHMDDDTYYAPMNGQGQPIKTLLPLLNRWSTANEEGAQILWNIFGSSKHLKPPKHTTLGYRARSNFSGLYFRRPIDNCASQSITKISSLLHAVTTHRWTWQAHKLPPQNVSSSNLHLVACKNGTFDNNQKWYCFESLLHSIVWWMAKSLRNGLGRALTWILENKRHLSTLEPGQSVSQLCHRYAHEFLYGHISSLHGQYHRIRTTCESHQVRFRSLTFAWSCKM